MNQRLREQGAANTWLIVGIIFIATTVLLIGGLVWALMNYFDQKNNVDTKVSAAVTTAVKDQADKDALEFEIADKKPNRQFSGPEDFGELRFDYPKTWSVYVANDATTDGVYEAYLNPVAVPTVDDETQFGLRVTIETKNYDKVIAEEYADLVKEGKLKSSVIKAGGQDATRVDGSFTDNIRGSAVIFKLRDKTVTLRTDADTFKTDFDAIIATIKVNL